MPIHILGIALRSVGLEKDSCPRTSQSFCVASLFGSLRIEEIASDANITRFNVVDMSNYPSPCPHDQEALEKTKSKTAQDERDKRLCAHAFVQVRLFLHSLGLEFVPAVDVGLCSTVTAADADLVLRSENSTRVWLFVHKFRSEWWCVKADYIQDNENLWEHISLVLPLHVTPLRIVVGNDAEVDEGKVTIVYLLLRLRCLGMSFSWILG